MKFVLLINLELLTITCTNSFLLNIAEHEIFYASKYENANYCWHFHIYLQRKFHAPLSWTWNKFYNLGACWWDAFLQSRSMWPSFEIFIRGGWMYILTKFEGAGTFGRQDMNPQLETWLSVFTKVSRSDVVLWKVTSDGRMHAMIKSERDWHLLKQDTRVDF